MARHRHVESARCLPLLLAACRCHGTPWACPVGRVLRSPLSHRARCRADVVVRLCLCLNPLLSRLPCFRFQPVSEPGFGYSAQVLSEVRSKGDAANVALSGFFQSYRYFHHHRRRLLQVLRLPPSAERQARHRLEALLTRFQHTATYTLLAEEMQGRQSARVRAVLSEAGDSNSGSAAEADLQSAGEEAGPVSIAVHIRRTDYVQYPTKHPMLPKEYYHAALKALQAVMHESMWRRRVLLVFCDDARWCEQQDWIRGLAARVLVVEEGAPDHVELRVMSLCRFLIIANSSFSWWAAYLSQATSSRPDSAAHGAPGAQRPTGMGKVVAPAAWFGEEGPPWEPGDLFPPDWIVV